MNFNFGTFEAGILLTPWWAVAIYVGLLMLSFSVGLHRGYTSGYEHGRRPFARARDAKGHFIGRSE